MATRKGRRIAIGTFLAVIVIAGTLAWLSRDHVQLSFRPMVAMVVSVVHSPSTLA